MHIYIQDRCHQRPHYNYFYFLSRDQGMYLYNMKSLQSNVKSLGIDRFLFSLLSTTALRAGTDYKYCEDEEGVW